MGCDRNLPCGPCTRARAPLVCAYPQETVPETLSRASVAEDERCSLPDPLQGAGSPSGIQQQQQNRERNDWTISEDSAVEQTLRDLTGKVQKFEQQLNLLTNREEAPEGEDEGLSVPATKPRLLAPASKMKFLGSTHWSHKVDEV